MYLTTNIYDPCNLIAAITARQSFNLDSYLKAQSGWMGTILKFGGHTGFSTVRPTWIQLHPLRSSTAQQAWNLTFVRPTVRETISTIFYIFGRQLWRSNLEILYVFFKLLIV